jgi:hypothetical protein
VKKKISNLRKKKKKNARKKYTRLESKRERVKVSVEKKRRRGIHAEKTKEGFEQTIKKMEWKWNEDKIIVLLTNGQRKSASASKKIMENMERLLKHAVEKYQFNNSIKKQKREYKKVWKDKKHKNSERQEMVDK